MSESVDSQDERREQIRERLARATPGPWTYEAGDPEMEPDAALIANAPSDLAFLEAECERKDQEIAALKDENERLVGVAAGAIDDRHEESARPPRCF